MFRVESAVNSVSFTHLPLLRAHLRALSTVRTVGELTKSLKSRESPHMRFVVRILHGLVIVVPHDALHRLLQDSRSIPIR